MKADLSAAWAHKLLAPNVARLARHGQLAQAEAWARALTELHPDAEMLCLLGKIQAQQLNVEQARLTLRHALEVDSGHVDAAAALDSLQRRRPTRMMSMLLSVLLGAALIAGAVWRGAGPEETPVKAIAPTTAMAPAPAVDARLLDEFAAVQAALRPLVIRHGLTLRSGLRGTSAVVVVSGSVPTAHVARLLEQAAAPHVSVDLVGLVVERRYKVVPGDTLAALAGSLYGDAALWRPIWQANRDELRSPHALRPGQILRLP